MPLQHNISNSQEIDQALKEFETKSKEEQPISNQKISVAGVITPQSSNTPSHVVEGVSFNSDTELESYGAIKFYRETVEPKMVKAVIKYSGGAVKDQKQAEYVLLGFVIVAIGISVFLFWKSIISSRGESLTPEQQSQMLLKIMPQNRSPVPH